MKFD
jgi:hypothetical protein